MFEYLVSLSVFLDLIPTSILSASTIETSIPNGEVITPVYLSTPSLHSKETEGEALLIPLGGTRGMSVQPTDGRMHEWLTERGK